MRSLIWIAAVLIVRAMSGAAFALISSAAMAQQGYTIFTPGQPRTFVNPNGNGGYTVFTPGRPRTFVDPDGAGGYRVFTPGHPRTFINPSPDSRRDYYNRLLGN
jgi:hypothetical protein